MSNAGPKHTSVATCHKDYGLLPISILSFFLSVRQLLSFSWDYLVDPARDYISQTHLQLSVPNFWPMGYEEKDTF